MPAPVPEPVDLGRAFAPTAPYHKSVRELHTALVELDPVDPLPVATEALERLAAWIRDPSPLPGDRASADARPQHARLRLLLDVIDQVAPWHEALVGVLAHVIAGASPVHLFAEVGVPSDRGFLDETADRLSQKLLPRARDAADLADLFANAFPHKRDAEWIAELPPPLMTRVRQLLPTAGAASWAPLQVGAADAVRLLAMRVSALGLSEEIRARSTHGSLSRSPFFLLPRVCEALIARAPSPLSATGELTDAADLGSMAEMCRAELAVVHDNLERTGVSVDVVYRMDVIGHCLTRLERLATFFAPPADPIERDRELAAVASALCSAAIGDLSLRALLRKNMGLLARKVIERVGGTGEHYITGSRREWWRMLRSAAGGGILTAGTAALKFIVGAKKLAIFNEAIVNSLNYAGSFIVMQLCGFTLATKQPSMTAAALAAALHGSSAVQRIEELVTMIACIVRSQLAAAMGNVFMVIPACIGVDALHRMQTGRSFLSPEAAEYVLRSLHPTQSATIWYAALTGVFLWLASLGAGWLENWMVYRRVPEAIAQHRAGKWLGRARMERLSRAFSRNISGFGGSVTLGSLLGLAPLLGKGFGLPIDVRHVTLSTGSLTLAVCALGPQLAYQKQWLAAALGIVIIGILNFGVSFLLALLVALRGRDVEGREELRLGRAVLGRMVRRPGEFIFPPKSAGDLQHH